MLTINGITCRLQEKDMVEEQVTERVLASYQVTASETKTLLKNKLKYLESLQI